MRPDRGCKRQAPPGRTAGTLARPVDVLADGVDIVVIDVATDAQRDHVQGLVEMTGRPFEDIWAERAKQNPARRYGEPAEIGAYVAFLCASTSGFITAQNLLIDGGQYPGTF